MITYYKELPLEEGFALRLIDRNSRIVAGREVSLCSGIALFASINGQISCWQCKCVADRWISDKHENHYGRPVLNLYATKHHKPTPRKPHARSEIVLMTRDHIIPKSLGGVDDLANLRPCCQICNGERGSSMSEQDMKFMSENPQLINEERQLAGLKKIAKRLESEKRQRLGKPNA